MTTSRLPMIPTHVMGSHGFPGWFWTALDKIKAGHHASSRRGRHHHPSAITLGVGVRLVARVDDRARRGRGARDLLADVLGALREAIVEAPRCLEHLARARDDLAGHEEGDECLGQALK
jgi:hypothetical protein